MTIIMKKLPIGLESFEKVIAGDFVYVDKTALIHKLISDLPYYFLLRSSGFGKSLLLSTIAAIFKGQKKLFKGLDIYSKHKTWRKYPIIHFDFSNIHVKNAEDLEKALKKEVIRIGKEHAIRVEMQTLIEGVKDLVRKIGKKKGAVVLVDAYDTPLLDHESKPKVMSAINFVLCNFFGVLKSLDEYLHFVFVTGDSHFSALSAGNLYDITTHPYMQTCSVTQIKKLLTIFQVILIIYKIREKY